MPTAIAKLKYLRISPKKVRPVANLIKGLSVPQAEAQLRQIHRRASGPLIKLLRSAVANAKQGGREVKGLYIAKITVDPGPSFKRILPRARGSRSLILKRTSHVTVELQSGPEKTFRETGRRPMSEPVRAPSSMIEREEGREEKKGEERAEKRPAAFRGPKEKGRFSFKAPSFRRRIFRRKAI